MDKKNYIIPQADVVMFSEEDVITASTPDIPADDDGPIELPFIPVP